MSQNIKKKLEKKNLSSFHLYIIIEVLVIIPSIFIPYNIIIYIHKFYGCAHHSGGLDGILWEWARALGWTALIWFIISSFQGFTINNHARFFHKRGKKKARDIHCFSSFLCIFFAFLHFLLLYSSEPWRSIFLLRDKEHFPYRIFQLKIGTGIYFFVIMTLISIISIMARDIKFMKRIGYKRFRYIHWIMIISTIILIFHVLYINTEIWIITGRKFR